MSTAVRWGALALLGLAGMAGCASEPQGTTAVAPNGPVVSGDNAQAVAPALAAGNPSDLGGAGTIVPAVGNATANPGTPGVNTTPGSTTDATGVASGSSTDLPCDVAQTLQTHCWKCHGEMTNWGGPMSLTRQEHFRAMGKLTTTSTVDALVTARLADEARPMPPPTEATMPESEKQVLTAWLAQGAPAGDGSACQLATAPDTGTTAPGTEGSGVQWEGVDTSWPDGVKPEETCYTFFKHGGQTPGDESPHMTDVNETYVNFRYKAPWTEPVVATRWRTIYDNTQVLHHWLLYKSPQPASLDGTWEPGLGTHPGAQLMAAWAVGGGDEDFPPGVGLRMPGPGTLIEVEWHLYNTTGAQVPDRSGIEICVVPESKADPRYVAGITWLGTEDLVLPPNQETRRGGFCDPTFKSGGPIHIVKWFPHMHLKGTHMDTWVIHPDGSEEQVFSKPFTFDQQVYHVQNPPVLVNQGDRLYAQCTFNNDTSAPVAYGESTSEEMCYQFAVAYPAGSLDGTSFTWNGSDNTCISLHMEK